MAAPPDTPSTSGSASGLRNKACNSTPASASRLPTAKPAMARGSRTVCTMRRLNSSPPPNKARTAPALDRPAEPTSNAAQNVAAASTASPARPHQYWVRIMA